MVIQPPEATKKVLPIIFFYNSALNVRDNQVSALFLFLEWHCAKKWRKRERDRECLCVCVN